MAIFLFLEVHDQTVVELLTSLRTALNGRHSNSPIHVTVRGPYQDLPPLDKVLPLWDELKGEGLFLNEIGFFENGHKGIVHIKARSKAIRRLWWKPDYPIERFGFNPHVTLFEGDIEFAKKVRSFLRNERLEFLCTDLSLRFHDTKQRDLFSQTENIIVSRQIVERRSPLIKPYHWNEGIIERAKALITST